LVAQAETQENYFLADLHERHSYSRTCSHLDFLSDMKIKIKTTGECWIPIADREFKPTRGNKEIKSEHFTTRLPTTLRR